MSLKAWFLESRLIYGIFIGLLVFVALVVCGCQKDLSIDDQKALMESWSEFARENDMAFSATANYGGKTGLYAVEEIGINTGASMSITVLGNSGDDDE